MSESRSPLRRLFGGSLLLLASAVAVWLAVRLLAEIWPWLLLVVLLAATVWVVVALRRGRRDRW